MIIHCMIDDREQSRGIRALNYFKKDGFKVEMRELLYGDFVFKSDGITVAFEYKTMEDFIGSVGDGRVFNQALNQSNEFDYHFVIVVGTDQEKSDTIREKQKYTGVYMTNKQFYGSLASICNISSLVQVPNEKSAFLCMEKFAEHCCNLKPVLKRFKKSRGSPALRLLANNVAGVGYVTAQNICDDLGLVTVEDVFGLTVDDLVGIKGVGVLTANNILKQLKNEFN